MLTELPPKTPVFNELMLYEIVRLADEILSHWVALVSPGKVELMSVSQYLRIVPRSCLVDVLHTQDLVTAFLTPTGRPPPSYQPTPDTKQTDSKSLFSSFLETGKTLQKFGCIPPPHPISDDLIE